MKMACILGQCAVLSASPVTNAMQAILGLVSLKAMELCHVTEPTVRLDKGVRKDTAHS